MIRKAEFSPCGQYRNWLSRSWDTMFERKQNYICFIGLNPSTANATDDDPTIRRVIAFAKREGYEGVIMLNLFSLVSADPKALLTHPDPIGQADFYLRHMVIDRPVVFCWGAFPEAQKRAKDVIAMFPNALCLGKTKEGHPKHPLYLAGNTSLIPFNQ